MLRRGSVRDDVATVLVNLITATVVAFVVEAHKGEPKLLADRIVRSTTLVELACALTALIGFYAVLRRKK